MDFHMQSPLGPRVVIGGRERDYFSGTGYLGLQNHPLTVQAAVDAIQRYGMATGTSRGGYGDHDIYDALEAEARRFFDADQALYYPSGYLSAAVIAQGLRDRYERIFIDESSHYSVWDGARLTGKPIVAFRHCDAQSLAECLRRELRPRERPLVLTDGIFPISGEIAPLDDYQQVLRGYPDAWLCLDDAHATGVLGPYGRGTLDHFGIFSGSLPGDEGASAGIHFVAGHTLSKAIGGYGGLIAGSEALIEEIKGKSRVYIGASPTPLPIAAATRQALVLAGDKSLRERLRINVMHARSGLRKLGWPLDDSPVPILCLGARPGIDLGRLKAALFDRDLCVAHVTGYSSTPPGGALRIAIFATHTIEQIDQLISNIAALI